MKKYLLLTLPAMMIAAPAAAQDLGGLRVEGVVVYDKVKGRLGSDPDLYNPARDRDFDVAYGVGLGYDFANFSGVSAGADVEFTESTAKRSVFDETGSEIGEIKIGTDFYVGGRVTAPITGNFSVVGKLGYTSVATRFNSLDETVVDDDSDRISGYRAGIGVDYSDPEDRTYYGLHYRYSNYEDGIVRHQLGLVVGARFGRRAVAEVIVPPAPVAAPLPPATQTCADGSVILASDACPALAPPPAPVNQPERG